MNRLIYLVGAPGAGKSTLMAKLTAKYHRGHPDRLADILPPWLP